MPKFPLPHGRRAYNVVPEFLAALDRISSIQLRVSFLFLDLGASKVIIFLTNLLIRENSNEAVSRKTFWTAGGIYVLGLSNSTKILVGIATVVH